MVPAAPRSLRSTDHFLRRQSSHHPTLPPARKICICTRSAIRSSTRVSTCIRRAEPTGRRHHQRSPSPAFHPSRTHTPKIPDPRPSTRRHASFMLPTPRPRRPRAPAHGAPLAAHLQKCHIRPFMPPPYQHARGMASAQIVLMRGIWRLRSKDGRGALAIRRQHGDRGLTRYQRVFMRWMQGGKLMRGWDGGGMHVSGRCAVSAAMLTGLLGLC